MQKRAEIDTFIASCRDRCLWSLARDAVPTTDAQRLQFLNIIRRTGTLVDFKRASELSEWLSQSSSDTSVSS
jgi:hypothetical protein